MLKRFKIGGIHPHDNKISAQKAIEPMSLQPKLIIPLGQHLGAPATSIVKKGDKVKVGDIIAEPSGFVSAYIHSPASGTVAAVDVVIDAMGLRKQAITINVEGDEWNENIDRSTTLVEECDLEAAEIITKIKEAGIVGMGGATFPTHIKLSPPPGKTAEVLIINGVECEPYLTSDHRLMIEKGEEMLVGVKILCKALGVSKAYIGIENNKPDAIAHLNKINKNSNIEIVPLRVQYPQGGEKQLIDAVIDRQVASGALPIETGAVVQNVGTAVAVYEAVQKNKPLFERVITLTGYGINEPKNLLVRVGTPISSLIDFCGGATNDCAKVINGGPMMGRSICNIEGTVSKGSSGILLMKQSDALRGEEQNCIRCGKCITVCPMGLEPYLIAKMSKLRLFDDLIEHLPNDCIECGSCSYTCPSSLPLLDYIRIGKGEVMKRLRAKK